MRILVVGCGDVGVRILQQHAARARIIGTARRREQSAQIRQAGGRALQIDLDSPRDCRRLAGLASRMIYLAPPDARNQLDNRLRGFLARLGGQKYPATVHLAYCGTTGVYGNAGGRLLTEAAPVRPESVRAIRRADAERQIRRLGRHRRTGPLKGVRLRAPGIYAENRLPVKRLLAGLPALQASEDSFSSHIHADDLARSLRTAVLRGPNGRAFNATDGQQIKMGDYFDQVADHFGLPRPRRLSPRQAQEEVSTMMWSFMRESRRLSNHRLLHELKVTLRFPTVAATLALTPREVQPFVDQLSRTLKGH